MSFHIRIYPPVARMMAGWPEGVLVEAYLRLREELAAAPSAHLVRTTVPFDGLLYGFSLVDPANRLIEHICLFQVVYGSDETSLIVIRASHLQRFGGG